MLNCQTPAVGQVPVGAVVGCPTKFVEVSVVNVPVAEAVAPIVVPSTVPLVICAVDTVGFG